MNLKAIRDRIANITDYKPSNQEHLTDMDQLINGAFQYVWLAKPWSFAQKIAYLNVYPDLSYALSGSVVTISVTDFRRQVVLSAPIKSLLNFKYEGQVLEVQGREYEILNVINDTTIRLVEPFRGTTTAADTTWRIKNKYYELPSDLVTICSVSHRDAPIVGGRRQNLIGISNKREEELSLSEDRTASYADMYINMPPEIIPSGEKLAFGGLATASGGSLTAGRSYEFCWAFRKGDSVGPLSEPLVIVVPTPEQGNSPAFTVQAVTHDNTAVIAPAYSDVFDKAPNVWEGLAKVLYVNVNYDHVTAERLGIPKWVAVTNYSGAATQYDSDPYLILDTANVWTLNYLQQVSPGNPQYTEVDGHYHLIRPYPRINGYDKLFPYATYADGGGGNVFAPEIYFRQLEIRYLYKPTFLTQVTDTPPMPYELHEMVVLKALEDYYNKKGNVQLAQLYRLRYEKDILAATSKYVERPDVTHQRSLQFGTNRDMVTASTTVRRSSF